MYRTAWITIACRLLVVRQDPVPTKWCCCLPNDGNMNEQLLSAENGNGTFSQLDFLFPPHDRAAALRTTLQEGHMYVREQYTLHLIYQLVPGRLPLHSFEPGTSMH